MRQLLAALLKFGVRYRIVTEKIIANRRNSRSLHSYYYSSDIPVRVVGVLIVSERKILIHKWRPFTIISIRLG